MSADRELAIRLAVDASELNKATAQGAAGFNALGAAGKKAGHDVAAGGAEAASAAAAEAAAVAKARQSAADAHRASQMAMRDARAEANLLKQANRQLAMQMTDVVTSVASGMPVWMVAIQQGGQIRDAYGGVGASLRAIGAMISPVVVGVGALAAVAGAVALAYRAGSAEADAYARALVMSGNAAGTTVGMLDETARSISAIVGTQAQAAEALAAAAGSGRVAAQNIEMVATAAVQMERTLGVAVGDTVAQFAELGRAPLQASVKLNDQYRYLTAAVYDQIKALTEQGRIAEAASVAQTAYADALKPRLADLESRLGWIERGWRAAGDAAKWAWDAMLGIGRAETPEQQLQALDEQIAQAERRAADARNSPLPAGPAGQGVEARELARLQAQREALRLQVYMQGESAAADKAAADAADLHIKTSSERDRRAKAAADEAARMAKARADAQMDALRSAAQGMAAIYAQEQQLLDAQRSAGLVSDRTYYDTRRQLIEQAARDQQAALAAEMAALQAQKLTGAEKIKRDAEVAAKVAESARVEAKARADITLTNLAEKASLDALTRAQAEYVRGLQTAADAKRRDDSRDLWGRAQGDVARTAASRQDAIADRFNAETTLLRRDLDSGTIKPGQFAERQAALRTYYEWALAEEQRYQDDRARIEADGTVGLTRALALYTESSANMARQTEALWTGAFTGMEDALVAFTMTGKSSFTALANSIVADLTRIYIRQQLVGMVGAGMDWLNYQGPVQGATGDFARMDRMMGAGQHAGGVMGIDGPTFTRSLPASTWASAPRLHTGRLAGNEYAAILQKDESVLTPGQMRQLAPVGAAAGAKVELNLSVINQSGNPVAATARQTSGGGIELLLTAAEAGMAGNVAGGQGPMYQALKMRFGLRD